MSENENDAALVQINISNIKKDEERLKLAKQVSQQTEEQGTNTNTDNDDLSNYTQEADGVTVLDSTTAINRIAIFHDLDRLKHWRESMDKSSPEMTRKTDVKENMPKNEPIMEHNIDLILNSLPEVESNDSTDEEAALQKLNELEVNMERKYSLHENKK